MAEIINEGNPFAAAKGISEKKSILCQLSAQAKQHIELLKTQIQPGKADHALPKINEVLIALYQSECHATFKTFQQWKAEGKQVKKGAKAFVIWGKPVTRQDEASEDDAAKEQGSYFPIAHIFSNHQVEDAKRPA